MVHHYYYYFRFCFYNNCSRKQFSINKEIVYFIFKDKISIIHTTLDSFKDNHKSLFLTSSFQTQSLVLLKIISDFDKSIPVYFLNTGFHFPETITFKDNITNLLKLNTIDVFSETSLSNQLNTNGRLLYTSNTDLCCELNKTLPLQKVLESHDVWITGIRKDQTSFRKNSKNIEKLQIDKIKYNPILDWINKDMNDFINYYKLPQHPLDKTGNTSIGCQPCTRLLNEQNRHEGRWYGQTKTECGIHLNFKKNR